MLSWFESRSRSIERSEIMSKKPILIGLGISLIGLCGWFLLIILNVLTLGHFRSADNFFGMLMLWGLPAGVIVAIIRRLRK